MRREKHINSLSDGWCGMNIPLWYLCTRWSNADERHHYKFTSHMKTTIVYWRLGWEDLIIMFPLLILFSPKRWWLELLTRKLITFSVCCSSLPPIMVYLLPVTCCCFSTWRVEEGGQTNKTTMGERDERGNPLILPETEKDLKAVVGFVDADQSLSVFVGPCVFSPAYKSTEKAKNPQFLLSSKSRRIHKDDIQYFVIVLYLPVVLAI